MREWWVGGDEDLHKKFTLAEQLQLGPGMLSYFRQRRAVGRMQEDPAVAGRFHPGNKMGLEFLSFEGEPMSISVVMRKSSVWQGKVKISPNGTDQEDDWKGGSLYVNGATHQTLVLSCLVEAGHDLSRYVTSVFIGKPLPSGFFDWIHRLDDSGEASGHGAGLGPEAPLFGPTKITLREPLVPKKPSITAVGPDVDEIRKEAERQHREAEERKGRSGRRGA